MLPCFILDFWSLFRCQFLYAKWENLALLQAYQVFKNTKGQLFKPYLAKKSVISRALNTIHPYKYNRFPFSFGAKILKKWGL